MEAEPASVGAAIDARVRREDSFSCIMADKVNSVGLKALNPRLENAE